MRLMLFLCDRARQPKQPKSDKFRITDFAASGSVLYLGDILMAGGSATKGADLWSLHGYLKKTTLDCCLIQPITDDDVLARMKYALEAS